MSESNGGRPATEYDITVDMDTFDGARRRDFCSFLIKSTDRKEKKCHG